MGGFEVGRCECVCGRVVCCDVVRDHSPSPIVLLYWTGMLTLHRSFIGYSNANYALSEIKDPIRTIKRAAPLAMGAVTLVYLLVNVAYFAVVSKGDILGSRRIVA
mgnify:CR=1 FL=1